MGTNFYFEQLTAQKSLRVAGLAAVDFLHVDRVGVDRFPAPVVYVLPGALTLVTANVTDAHKRLIVAQLRGARAEILLTVGRFWVFVACPPVLCKAKLRVK